MKEKNGNGQTQAAADATAIAKKQLTKAEKLALFEAYESACKQLGLADKAVAAARQKVSDAVKAIVENLGNGPFDWKGRELLATMRGDVHFFRGRTERQVERIG